MPELDNDQLDGVQETSEGTGTGGSEETTETTEQAIDGDSNPRRAAIESAIAELEQRDAAQAQEELPEEEKPLPPPDQWSEDDQKVFNELPRAAQESWLKREKGMQASYTRAMQEASPYRKLNEEFGEYIKERAVNPTEFYRGWAAVDKRLNDAQQSGNPVGVLEILYHMASHYGVDFEAIQQQQAEATQQELLGDPLGVGQQLREHMQPYEDFMQKQEEADRQAAQQAATHKVNAIQQQLDQFAAQKDAAGNSAYPYFHHVQNEMMAAYKVQRAAGRNPTLPELYETACNNNPQVRADITRRWQAYYNQKAQEDAKQAQRRNDAAGGVSGSGSTGGVKGNNRRAAIRAAMEAADYNG